LCATEFYTTKSNSINTSGEKKIKAASQECDPPVARENLVGMVCWRTGSRTVFFDFWGIVKANSLFSDSYP